MLRDEELALGVKNGDMRDLSALVERHHSPLLGFLYRMTGGNHTLAEDLVQETFLRLLRAIHQYQYPRPFKPWLYMIATNLARDYYKRAEIRHVSSMPHEDMEHLSDQNADPDHALLVSEENKRVIMALQGLPDGQREVIVLRYFQELSLVEISEVLSVPVGTVKSRLSIGLGRLRVSMLQEEA